MPSDVKHFFRKIHVFSILVTFRWMTLIPAIWLLLHGDILRTALPLIWTFFAAVAVNTVILLFKESLNRLVLEHPPVMGLDLLFCALLLATGGGPASPFYLYILSPLLASAFFFQLRGALFSSLAFTFFYLGASAFLPSPRELSSSHHDVMMATQLAGIWLIPLFLVHPSILLKELHQAHERLAAARDELAKQNRTLNKAHRQLRVIHDLTLLLQAAPDVASVQQRVLRAVTGEAGFRSAVVGIIDPAHNTLGDWHLYPVNSSFPSADPLPLTAENGEICRAILEHRPLVTLPEHRLIAHHALNAWLKTYRWYVYPLWLREHPVGVLLVDLGNERALSQERENMIKIVGNQAALALGTTILCIDRARRLAVETERNRLAREIHDTVAQSLFGIIYSLDACINLLPNHAEEVRQELVEIHTLAKHAYEEIRRSILDLWPTTLTTESFQLDLLQYVSMFCHTIPLNVAFDMDGNFDHLPPRLRRTLYRIAQEALTNIMRHSGASLATVQVKVSPDSVSLLVSDNGIGFDPALALSRSVNREHFGLRGIQERVQSLGGRCEIDSSPGNGTRILVVLPVNGAHD